MNHLDGNNVERQLQPWARPWYTWAMTEWKHPDDLDRVTAAVTTPEPSTPASSAEVARTLDKVLKSGGLTRVPRHPEHRAIVLALLCSDLRRRHPYTEAELNDVLRDGLARMRARVDHVTCRRYLVDTGFVKRDRAGNRYLLNFPRLAGTLAAAARAEAHELVRQALSKRR